MNSDYTYSFGELEDVIFGAITAGILLEQELIILPDCAKDFITFLDIQQERFRLDDHSYNSWSDYIREQLLKEYGAKESTLPNVWITNEKSKEI